MFKYEARGVAHYYVISLTGASMCLLTQNYHRLNPVSQPLPPLSQHRPAHTVAILENGQMPLYTEY